MLVDLNRLKIAAAAILLSPYIPMLFMGEEYGEDTPFFYFVSHSDKSLIRAVQDGRKKDFEKYKSKTDPPYPQDETTFNNSKIKWEKRRSGKYRILLEWHKELISLRSKNPALHNFNKNDVRAYPVNDQCFVLYRQSPDEKQVILSIFNLSEKEITYTLPSHTPEWSKLLDSNDIKWADVEQKKTSSLPSQAGSGQIVILPGCSIVVYANYDHL